MTIKDDSGRFTSEVWAAVQNWTDLGGLHIFYVPDFDPPGLEGGICLRVSDLIDPIIFVNQKGQPGAAVLDQGCAGCSGA
jgi:hypothetical protein